MYCVIYLTFVLLVINCLTSLDWRTLSELVIYICILCEVTQRITTGGIPREVSVSANRKGFTLVGFKYPHQCRIADFPEGGGGGGKAPTPVVGVLTDFFPRKLHENERIWTRGRGG